MSALEHPQMHIHQNNQQHPASAGKSATSSGIFSLVLAGVAFLSAPIFLLIPYIGFLPAIIAAAGAVIAIVGLRGSTRGTGTAVAGLAVSVVVFALLAGISTMWNLVITDPAIRDYDKLHEVIEYIKQLIVG
ncbi:MULTISPECIES: hypothetical protein [Brachybacterium]|uniref:hypothetical protein n=1 Tax=Brachybacterium TaxID=43668 RepID=UPI002653890B|nr:hypothetical protein [Kocuria sp.]